MMDPRWSELRDSLLARGWTLQEESLYAPHGTMWFSASSDSPDLTRFRDRMCRDIDATASYADVSIDQADLHADLVSLVAALDAVLAN